MCADMTAPVAFRKVLNTSDKKARFPGFHQGTRVHRAGSTVRNGARPLTVDIELRESTPMQLPDGTKLYCDVFLPAVPGKGEPIPALIAWSPYGKQGGTTRLDDFPMRAGVPRNWTSGLEKWEGPDPAYWCERGYAVVNVDSRGAFTSEGDLLLLGREEAEDAAAFTTWTSKQDWCNGRVVFTGNSWLSIVQWKVASLRPAGLAAIAPWEGFQDLYRDHMCTGGAPFPGFVEMLESQLVSSGKAEDLPTMLKQHPLFDGYWQSKRADIEKIDVPVYCVASWSNPLHSVGTLNAWRALSSSTPKWLRIHATQEWSDYYTDANVKDLQRFFDRYLKDDRTTDWEMTPPVRISVLRFGLTNQPDTVNRFEMSFPLVRTRYTRHYLTAQGALQVDDPSGSESYQVSYDGSTGQSRSFTYTMPAACETTGYFMAHLHMSCDGHDDMDVYVQVEKLSADHRSRQGSLCIQPPNSVVKFVFKMMHNYQVGVKKTGPLFYWGPSGVLRASHALDREESSSTFYHPVYQHDREVKLRSGERRALDIPLKAAGLFWEKGDVLKFTVSGQEVVPFPIPGVSIPATRNAGKHVIHCGGLGPSSSYLLIPYV